MQQKAVDCLSHVLIAVHSVLYSSVSLHQCSAFVGVLWLCIGCGEWCACWAMVCIYYRLLHVLFVPAQIYIT